MKKLVLKTASLTLAGILALGVILFGIFSLFSPKTIANTADKMGNYSVSVFYYEKAYEKSGYLEDLYDLIVKIDATTDGAKAEKYCGVMFGPTNANKLTPFLLQKDREVADTSITTHEYLYGKYAIALCSQSDLAKIDKLITVCVKYTEDYGYTENHPLTTAVSACVKNLSKEELQKLSSQLGEIQQVILTKEDYGQELNRFSKDKTEIQERLNELN